ncbi:MAG TPA: O-antigen ligase family protein [Usitatibacter sp.]|nr:O-antigen ligase family protein [Usitatibacter sp.]
MATSGYLFVAPFPSSAGVRAFALLVALGALGIDIWKNGGTPARLPRAVLFAGIAWLGWCTATLLWSERPAYSLEELQRELGYGSLAFIAFFAGTRGAGDARRAVAVLFGGALLFGLFEWIAVLHPELRLAERYRSADGSFSTHLVIVAPLLALVASGEAPGLRAPPSLTVALALGLVAAGLASENRMLWIALLAQLACAFYVNRRLGGGPLGARPRRMLAVALGVIVLALAASWLHKAARYYPEAAGALQSLEFDQRPAIWTASLPLFLDRPWVGHGFGREILHDRFEAAVPSASRGPRIDHAHNVFIDVALATGVVGLVLFAGLLLALLRAFLDAGRRPAGASVAIAGTAMTVGFLVKSLTDDFYFRPNSLVFWALSGVLLALSARPRG